MIEAVVLALAAIVLGERLFQLEHRIDLMLRRDGRFPVCQVAHQPIGIDCDRRLASWHAGEAEYAIDAQRLDNVKGNFRRADGFVDQIDVADLLGEPGVATHLAARNLRQLLQNTALELRRIAKVDCRLLDTLPVQRSEDLFSQRIGDRRALERASISFCIPGAKIIQRSRANHPNRAIRKRDPHVLHLIEKIGGPYALAHRPRRYEGKCFHCSRQVLDISGGFLTALACLQVLFDRAMFFVGQLTGTKRIDACQCWSTPHTRLPFSPAPPAVI